jgi:hypothetical protein
MAVIISGLMNTFLSNVDIRLYCDTAKEFTQMVVCVMPSDPACVITFIEEVSRVNPLYAVRIIEGELKSA